MRVMMFMGTNIAVLLVLSVVMKLFGGSIAAQGNYASLLVSSAVFGFVGSFISLFMSKWMAKRSAGVELIETPKNDEERWLYETVEELAQKAGIKMPEVGIFPGNQPNAFATGWNRNAALVAVNTALLRGMTKDEVRAVLAHEIAHVTNGDMVTLTLVQGVVNTFVIFFARLVGMFVDRVLFKNDRGNGFGYYISYMAAQVVFGILASAIVSWFSRYREFRADEGGATYADRQSMIAALERLKGGTSQEEEMPASIQAFGISPSMRKGLSNMFATHPPLDVRIAALRENA